MKERHISRVLKKCCRLCGKSSPKTKILPFKNKQAEWFGLQIYECYKICWVCDEIYECHKNQEFEAVKSKFKLPNSEIVQTDACNINDPCYFCKLDAEWKDAKDIDKREKQVNLKKRSHSVQKFLTKRLEQGNSDVHLSNVFHKKELVPDCKRIEYHGKARDFLYCEICPAVVTYKESSITGFHQHIRSKRHQENILTVQPGTSTSSSSSSTGSCDAKIRPDSEALKKFGERIFEYFVGLGKVSANSMESEWMNKGFQLALNEINVEVPDNFLMKRDRGMRFIESQAESHRQKTKKEIADAIKQNPDIQFTFQFDDGVIRNGNKENCRALALGWADKITGINRRFIQLTSENDKSSRSLKTTIEKAATDYGVPDNYILLSDAASANMAISSGDNRQHTTCGDHLNHNAFEKGLKQGCEKDPELQHFFQSIEQTLEKSSRKHINQQLMHVNGWRKLKARAPTRWASIVDSTESIIKVYDILQDSPEASKLALFKKKNGNYLYTKHDLEQFFEVSVPFRKSIKRLEGTKQSNGHLVAMELQNLLVFYVNYNYDENNPKMFRNLAGQFIKQLEEYFDGVQEGRRRILKRIDNTRLVQTAFYLPSNMLGYFNPTSVVNQEKHKEMYDRYKRLHTELTTIIDEHNSKLDESNQSNVSNQSFSLFQQSHHQSELDSEILQYSSLASKFANQTTGELPSILKTFKKDMEEGRDANTNFWTSEYANDNFPTLQKIIIPLLAVSASTALVEGTFSHCNQIRTPNRSRLLTKHIDNFLVCHYARLLTDRYK